MFCTVMGFLQWVKLFAVLCRSPSCCVNPTWLGEEKCWWILLKWFKKLCFFAYGSLLFLKQGCEIKWAHEPQFFKNKDRKQNLNLSLPAVNDENSSAVWLCVGELRVKLGSCSQPSQGAERTLREHCYPKGPLFILLWMFAHSHQEGIGFKCSAAEHPLVMCLFLLCLLKSNVYIWHILGCCHGNGCIDTSTAEQLCSVLKDQDDGWERKRPLLSTQLYIIFVLQLLDFNWKAQSCWMGCFELILKELCRTIPNAWTENITEHHKR